MDEVQVTVESDRPFSAGLVESISHACDRAEAAGRRAVLVLRLAGAEDGERGLPFGPGVHAVNQWERVLRRLERLAVPTVAVAGGDCRGLAAEALLVADHRVAAPDFTFRLCGDPTGTWPSMAVHRLGRQLGAADARRIVLFRPVLDARRAADIGLVDEVADEPQRAVREFVDAWHQAPPTDVALCRSLLLESAESSHEVALGSHLAACDRMLRRVVPAPAPTS